MRENHSHFKNFIGVFPGGGTRRNPRRGAAALSSRDIQSPTESEVDRAFEKHLERMAEGGTFGDNLEVSAFARAFDVNVKIFQREVAYLVKSEPEATVPKKTLYIAYHGPVSSLLRSLFYRSGDQDTNVFNQSHEHYSSIRNLEGPHEGLPMISEKALSEEEKKQQMAAVSKASIVQEWMIENIQTVVPQVNDRSLIAKTLEVANGDVEQAAVKLMDLFNKKSPSSSSRASSSERSSNVSRNHLKVAPKRLGRSKSKQPRAATASREDRRRTKQQHRRRTAVTPSQESLSSASTTSLPIVIVDSDSDDWRSSPFREGSVSSTGTSQKIPTRVKINMPRVSSPARKIGQKQVGVHRRRRLMTALEKREMLERRASSATIDSQSNGFESGFRTLIL